MKKSWQLPTSIMFMLATSHSAYAQQPSEEDELAAAYGEQTVSIATGAEQPLSKAPSSATVITAREIQAMGARYLWQALVAVPGLHASRSAIANQYSLQIRGLSTQFNPEVLILINGFPINTAYDGSPGLAQGEISILNASRIEIIRGPGSALYGADAFSGVINIITKNSDEINGWEVGAGGGTFETKDTWMQYGGLLGSVKSVFFLRYSKTDGDRGIIERDTQSFLDAIFGTRASLAPGPINNDAREVDARLDLTYKNFRLRAGLETRKFGTGAGLNGALDPEGKFPATHYNLDFTYQKQAILPSLDIAASYSYYGLEEEPGDPAFRLLPRGTTIGTDFYPDGVIGNPGHSERVHRIGVSASYAGIKDHKIRLGAGFESHDLYKAEEYKNFTFVNGALTPLGRVVNATGIPDLVYILPQKRNLKYAFAQDEWALAKDWNLTVGVRHDKYSDFGNTTNPRLALVWNAAYNTTVKFLHGRAFRAPAFTELSNLNNPVANGNPNIAPERIKTTELAILWAPKPNLQTSFTLFNYKRSNIIQYIVGANGIATAGNEGDQTGRGAELEATWKINRNLNLVGNYSYQKLTDEATRKDAGLAPHHRLFIRSEWQFLPLWQLGTTVNYVADRRRQQNDARPQIADYTMVDMSLKREKLFKNWEMQATIRNLFDRDAREPTLAPGLNLPDDLPLPKRSFYLQLSTKF